MVAWRWSMWIDPHGRSDIYTDRYLAFATSIDTVAIPEELQPQSDAGAERA